MIDEKTLNNLYLKTQVGKELTLTVNGKTDNYTVLYKDPVRVELSKTGTVPPVLATTWAGLYKKMHSMRQVQVHPHVFSNIDLAWENSIKLNMQ